MKSLLQILTFLICIISIVFPQNLKVTNYDLNLELFPNKDKINETSIVRMKSLDTANVNKVTFNFVYDKIESVSDLKGNKCDFKEDGDKLIVRLNEPISPEGSTSIKIKYQAKFYDYWTQRNITLTDEAEFYPQLENWDFAKKGYYNSRITVPEGMIVISPGNLIKTDTLKGRVTYHYKTLSALYSICAGKFSTNKKIIDNIKIETFLLPGHNDQSDSLIDYAAKVITFYQERFGKFPLTSYKIVEAAVPSGGWSGYSPKGVVLLSSNIINEKDILTRFIIAHEIAHQWFPHRITFNYHDWYLNESFAQYAANSFFRNVLKINNKSVKVSRNLLFLSLGAKGDFGNLFRIFWGSPYEEKPVSQIRYGDNLYGWAAYYKGYFFLSSLAFSLGVNNFDNAIKKLVESDKKDIISQQDFIKYLEKKTGKNLHRQVNDWLNTNKVIDYDICSLNSKETEDGNYWTTVQIKNNGNMSFPFQVMAETGNGKKIIKDVDTLQKGINNIKFHTDNKIVKAEIDPDWYVLDCNRINNYYPRRRSFSFLVSDLNLSEEQYFYYPSFTFGNRDHLRLGLWLSNIYPVEPDKLSENLEPLKWRAGLFYGFGTRRPGYYSDFQTILGMPSYRWKWGMNLYNFRGTENYGLNIDYFSRNDERHGGHNILSLSIDRNLIYDITFYDKEDFQSGANNSLSLSWDRKLYNEKENVTFKIGSKLFDGNFSYSRISIGLENFLPVSTDWLKYRLFGGMVRGNYPSQESIFLSGSVYPSSFAYWFVDPGSSISTQRNLHVEGDANLRGYIGQHLRGRNGFGINLEAPIPYLNIFNVFCDLGNVWDKSFGSLKYDLGFGISVMDLIKIDFPLYINQPLNNGKKFDFRWLVQFNF